MDNIFIERLWRALKYEAVYLHDLADGFEARHVIDEWVGFYNTERPHLVLDEQPPAAARVSTASRDRLGAARHPGIVLQRDTMHGIFMASGSRTKGCGDSMNETLPAG